MTAIIRDATPARVLETAAALRQHRAVPAPGEAAVSVGVAGFADVPMARDAGSPLASVRVSAGAARRSPGPRPTRASRDLRPLTLLNSEP